MVYISRKTYERNGIETIVDNDGILWLTLSSRKRTYVCLFLVSFGCHRNKSKWQISYVHNRKSVVLGLQHVSD